MLVHRMVKNVKDSKVLEKIRTRDARNLADLQDVNYKGYLISVTYDGWFFVQTKSASGGWKPVPNAKFGNIDQAKAFIDSHPVKDSKTKDMKVTITIEDEKDIAEPAPKELIPFEGENYKGFEIKQDEETGEFDVYAPGGALVAHTDTLVLAHDYIDSVDVGV